MGVSYELSVIRWGLPSLRSAFTPNLSPPCCSTSCKFISAFSSLNLSILLLLVAEFYGHFLASLMLKLGYKLTKILYLQ